MLSVNSIIEIVIGLFLIQALLHLLLNPHALRQEPTNERVGEVVENRGTRAMGIFAVVLVVVSFVLTSPIGDDSLQFLALVTTLLSAGFLMLAFMVEVYGGLNDFLFKLQEDSLTYAGLLLFSGLYLIVASIQSLESLSFVILAFVIISWVFWFYYKVDYLFIIQRREWSAIHADRLEYVRNALANFLNKLPI